MCSTSVLVTSRPESSTCVASLSASVRDPLLTLCGIQGPQKSVTAAVPATSSTFFVGTADGRVLHHADDGYDYVGGEAHATLVTGLGTAQDGRVYSVGLDDRLREIEGKSYT